MINLPKRLPESRQAKKLFRWLNELRDYCESLRIQPGVNYTASRTTRGTTLKPRGKGGGGGAGGNDRAVWL